MPATETHWYNTSFIKEIACRNPGRAEPSDHSKGKDGGSLFMGLY